MNSLWFSTSVPLILMLLAAGLGMRIRLELKEHHKDVETTDLLRVTVTMLVTFAAIVLGLLITSSKTSFDAADSAMQNYASTLTDLNNALQAAGPAAAPIRQDLAQYTAATIASTWVTERPPPGNYYPRDVDTSYDGVAYESADLGAILHGIDAKISALPEQTAPQQLGKTTCAAAMNEVFQQRLETLAAEQHSLSAPFFIVLIFWLSVVFLCLGLSTPLNALSAITLVLSAISLASALFVVADMNGLYSGVFVVSSEPMRGALAQML